MLSTAPAAMVFRRVARNEVFRHGAIVFAGLSVNNALNFVFHFSMTRLLGVQSYAVLSALISVSFVAVIPAAVAVTVVAKYAAQYKALSEDAKLWALIRRVLIGSSLTAMTVFAVGTLIRGPVASFLHIGDLLSVTLCLAIIAVMFVEPVLRGILQGVQDFTGYGVSYAIEGVGKLAFALMLVRAGYGVNGALLGMFFGSLLALAYTIVPVINYRVCERTSIQSDVWRLLRVTWSTTVGIASMSLLGFMDMLLVKHYFSAHEAGVYAAVSIAGKIVFFMVGFAPTVLLPKATARAKVGLSPARLLAQAGLLTAAISAVTLAVFAFAPHEVISVIAGAQFSQAASYVLEYGCAMAFLAAANLVVNYKIGLHQFDFVVPALIAPVAEAVAIALYHRTLGEVAGVLVVGHSLMFLSTLYRVGRNAPSAAMLEAQHAA